MKCGTPRSVGGILRPCGQCPPCRINKKREWAGRLILEDMYTPGPSAFVTLTYNGQHVPQGGKLCKDDLTLYLDRLRKTSGLGGLRYFACGEYGDQTMRPHYHLLLFGVNVERWGHRLWTAWKVPEERRRKNDPEHFGTVDTQHAGQGSMHYIAGYVEKKMVLPEDPRLPQGHPPEFFRFTKRNPLGEQGHRVIRDALMTKTGSLALARNQDVPAWYRVGSNTYPFSRYWRKWLRSELGIHEPPVYSEWEIDYATALQELEKAKQISIKIHSELLAKRRSRQKI